MFYRQNIFHNNIDGEYICYNVQAPFMEKYQEYLVLSLIAIWQVLLILDVISTAGQIVSANVGCSRRGGANLYQLSICLHNSP